MIKQINETIKEDGRKGTKYSGTDKTKIYFEKVQENYCVLI